MCVSVSVSVMYVSVCVMSNQSTSKSHVICVKLSVNFRPCCINHTARHFSTKMLRLHHSRSVITKEISLSKLTIISQGKKIKTGV